jgi:hypothetical protein
MDGTVFVSASPSAFFDDVVALVLRFLPETELPHFTAAYGQPPNVQPFVDLLAVHEVAHVFHAEREFGFSPFWVGELFCNLALDGYVTETEPSERSVLDGFPVAARHIPPTAVLLSALEEMANATPLNYGWFQATFTVSPRAFGRMRASPFSARYSSNSSRGRPAVANLR